MLKPKTDVNWDRDIVTNPIWVKNGVFELGVGVLHINYTATHPISHISLSCDFTVTVLGETFAVSIFQEKLKKKIVVSY